MAFDRRLQTTTPKGTTMDTSKYNNSTEKADTGHISSDYSEIDSAFDSALEELAAEREVTVDYYMEEFLI